MRRSRGGRTIRLLTAARFSIEAYPQLGNTAWWARVEIKSTSVYAKFAAILVMFPFDSDDIRHASYGKCTFFP